MIKLRSLSYKFSIFFYLYILLATNSCAPMAGTYYKPSYPDNSAIINVNKGGPGATDEGLPAHIEFSVKDGVRIEANVREWGGSLDLLLHLYVPPGSSAQFVTNRFILTNLESGEKQEFEIYPNVTFGYYFNDLIHGDDKIDKIGIFWFRGLGEKSLELESLAIKLPDILINGEKTDIKPITFKKSLGAYIAPIP